MYQGLYLLLTGLYFLFTDTNTEDTTTGRSSNVKITNNARIPGFILSTKQSFNILACAHVCLSHAKCASFNFHKRPEESGNCELNTDGFLYKNIKPQYHAGWTYGFITGRSYAFNVTFTTLNGVGAKGPTNTSQYTGTLLQDLIQLQNGIQIWRVPIRGTYTIVALGASGGNGTNGTGSRYWRLGGRGARIQGDFYLLEGTILKVLVGQNGFCAPYGSRRPGGGGGGSFVTLQDNTPLIIAGGGGGGAAPWIGFHHGDNAEIIRNGSTYGGSYGTGGTLYDVPYRTFHRRYQAAAGGGLLTNGASGNYTSGGRAFINGGEGGMGRDFAQGGFGGGGGASLYPGGGGGYSGGGIVRATRYTKAGGGGSFNGGIRKKNSTRLRRGPGIIKIRLIKSDVDMM